MSEPAYMLPDEPLLDKDEVARRLDVSTKTIERLVAEGELEPFYIGTRPKFDPREVAAFLERNRGGRRRRRSAPRPRLVEPGASDSFVDRLRSPEQ